MGWIRQQAETPVLIQPFLYSAYRSRQAVLAGNLLTDQIRPIYFKYLAAFGSVLISSIYGVVDAAMVGQCQGPTGTAALAVVAPVWNIIYSLGLLTGIGGSVLFSTMRGQAADNEKKSNEYFSAAVIGTVILAALTWVAVIFFDWQFLTLFGAEETLLPLAREYLFPIKFVVPSFLFTQLMAAFLRNDGAPALATKSVLFGGVFNVFGDHFFVFTLDMGIMGAGIATAMGSVFSLLMMLTHFFKKKNTLHLEKPTQPPAKLRAIGTTGIMNALKEVAMGILTMFVNRQFRNYTGSDARSVYGMIINISAFVQCCAYSIGQASQPIISVNYGAGEAHRIGEILKYALGTAAVFGVVWTLAAELVPNGFVRIFITPTDSILSIAPGIIRRYGISFLLPFRIFSTYYFQAMMKPSTAFVVSVSRGAVRSSRSGNSRTHIQTYFSRAVKSGALRKQTGHPNRPGRFRSSRCQLIELSAAAAMYRYSSAAARIGIRAVLYAGTGPFSVKPCDS